MEVDELTVSSCSFLDRMRKQHVRYFNEIAMRTNFAEGEWIFREGERADRFYLIEEGSVIITSRMPMHRHIVIQTLGAGNAVGWSGLFKPYTWHLDARADEPTSVLSFCAVRLREQCKRDPELGYELMQRVGYMLIHSPGRRLPVGATDGDLNWWNGKVKGRTPIATIVRPIIAVATPVVVTIVVLVISPPASLGRCGEQVSRAGGDHVAK